MKPEEIQKLLTEIGEYGSYDLKVSENFPEWPKLLAYIRQLEQANEELRLLNNSVFNVSRREGLAQKQRSDEVDSVLQMAVEALEDIEIEHDDFDGETEPDYEDWEEYLMSMETKRQLAIMVLQKIRSLQAP